MRVTRAREYLAYALIAGMTVADARKSLPGVILDCYKIRARYDAQMAGHKIMKRTGLI